MKHAAKSVWQAIAETIGSFSARTGLAGSLANALDPDNWLPGGRDAAFTLALVALSAKMAVADGVVVNAEIAAFERLVEVPPEAEEQVQRLFELAQQDVAGYSSYARKVARLFADNPETLELVLCGLFSIAAADGMIHEAELAYLRDVGEIFGFDEPHFEQIAAQHMVRRDEGVSDPYLVLGVGAGATDEEVRAAYRRLAREHHPDRLQAAGVPEEMMDMVNSRMAAINAAWESIRQARGL